MLLGAYQVVCQERNKRHVRAVKPYDIVATLLVIRQDVNDTGSDAMKIASL